MGPGNTCLYVKEGGKLKGGVRGKGDGKGRWSGDDFR